MNGRVSPLGMDWDKLRVFHAVAAAGSFIHAGELLNLSQSAISRQISSLEESLKVLLFHRHARGLILTEQGSLLYEAVHDVFVRLAQTELKLAESKDKPEGPLVVTTPLAFGSFWLAPRLKPFLDQYPAIQMTLKLDDGELDLSMREADVALRFAPPRQSDLIQRHLRTLQYRVYASPDYLQHNGTPQAPRDLAHHRLISCDDGCGAPDGWLLAEGLAAEDLARQSRLTVNSLYGAFRAVHEGIGIAPLPEYFWSEAGALVHILPDMTGPGIDVFLVYPEELRHSKRVSVFRDFIVRNLAEPAIL